MRPEPLISPMFMSTHSLSDWNCECMKMWRRCTVHIHFIRDWTTFDHHVLKGVMATVTRGMWTNLLSQQWSSPSWWWSLSPASRMTLNQFASSAQTPHLSFKHLRYLEDRYGNRLPLATTRYHYVPPCLRETHIEEKQARKRQAEPDPIKKEGKKNYTTAFGHEVRTTSNTGSCSRRLWGFLQKILEKINIWDEGMAGSLWETALSWHNRLVFIDVSFHLATFGQRGTREGPCGVCVCACCDSAREADTLTGCGFATIYLFWCVFCIHVQGTPAYERAHWPFNFGLFNICNYKLTHIIAINVKLSGCVIV